MIEVAGIFAGVYATSGMIHSLVMVIYEAAFKQCSNLSSLSESKRKSESDETTPIVAIGITPESSAVM